MTKKHNHYHKPVTGLDTIDVYDVLRLFEVQSHPVGHAIKKLLMAGKRGAKDYRQDLQEAIDSVQREIAITGLDQKEPEKDVEGWIEWHGGECPVRKGDTIAVKFRGHESISECIAPLNLRWRHIGCDSDIIAYRVSKTS